MSHWVTLSYPVSWSRHRANICEARRGVEVDSLYWLMLLLISVLCTYFLGGWLTVMNSKTKKATSFELRLLTLNMCMKTLPIFFRQNRIKLKLSTTKVGKLAGIIPGLLFGFNFPSRVCGAPGGGWELQMTCNNPVHYLHYTSIDDIRTQLPDHRPPHPHNWIK